MSATFVPPASAKPEHQGLKVTLHYEMYVGIPLLAKWLTLEYVSVEGMGPVMVDGVTVEYLATQKPYNLLDHSQHPLPIDHRSVGGASWSLSLFISKCA